MSHKARTPVGTSPLITQPTQQRKQRCPDMVDGINPGFLSLPSELKHHIADLCSHSSLASLARTHTAYQREAEQALYRDISIVTSNENHLRCMDTLATNSEKATLVRSLTIECEPNNSNKTDRAITYLLQGLRNMHSISDFRLRLPRHDNFDGWIPEIDKILCEGHFQLKTLYFNQELDFVQITESQAELEILGLYGNRWPPRTLLKTLKIFQNAQLLPIVFMLEHRSYSLVYEHILIFPAFYSVDRCATIHQILAKSIGEDQGSVVRANLDKVDQLSIYLIDSADMPTIHALARNMAITFPRIVWLNIFFEHQCETLSQEMKEVLSPFSNLREVHFSPWPESNGSYTRRRDLKIPREVKMAHAKEWGDACPELFSVTFLDGSILKKGWRYVQNNEGTIGWMFVGIQ